MSPRWWAYAKLLAYFNSEYLPAARQNTVASDGLHGRADYDFLARFYTTTNLSAEDIHALGLQGVSRIRAAMETVKAKAGFAGTLSEYG